MAGSKVRSSQEKYTGPAFSVVSEEVEFSNGLVAVRDVVKHPGAVVILPLMEDGSVLFVRQYRHPIGSEILELPAGTLEAGEEPLTCAKREICEEVGYAARDWQPLGTLYPAPGFCDEVQHLFLASDLYAETLPGDEDEIIEVECYPISRIKSLVADGEIKDAKTISCLMHAQIAGIVSL